MAIETDLKFYIDDNLKNIIELCIKREEHGFDNVLIIDGDNRLGKSTLAKTICYYKAHKQGKKFSLNNIFFDPEEMLDFAEQTTKENIIWDEAALGGQGIQWQNKIQQKLNTTLMIAAKYCHFYVFIIPSFFRLNRYLAIDRSLALIHVFTPDLLTRGQFTCFNKGQKTWIYNNFRKSETYGKSLSFRGRFTKKNTEQIIDEVAYENKKDLAIKNFLKQTTTEKKDRLSVLTSLIVNKMSKEQIIDTFGIHERTYREWRKKANGAVGDE